MEGEIRVKWQLCSYMQYIFRNLVVKLNGQYFNGQNESLEKFSDHWPILAFLLSFPLFHLSQLEMENQILYTLCFQQTKTRAKRISSRGI